MYRAIKVLEEDLGFKKYKRQTDIEISKEGTMGDGDNYHKRAIAGYDEEIKELEDALKILRQY